MKTAAAMNTILDWITERMLPVTREEIIKKAFEIGMMIADSKEKQAMDSLQEEIKEDGEAFNLLVRFQDFKGQIEVKRASGQELDENDQKQMRVMQQELGSNRLIQEFGAQKEGFDNLMNAVYFANESGHKGRQQIQLRGL